jgi:hypothetical protein
VTRLRGGVSGAAGCFFGFLLGRLGCWRTAGREGLFTRVGVAAAGGGGGEIDGGGGGGTYLGAGGGGGGGGTYLGAGGGGGGGGGSGLGRVAAARIAARDPPATAYVAAKPSTTRQPSSASHRIPPDTHHAPVTDRKFVSLSAISPAEPLATVASIIPQSARQVDGAQRGCCRRAGPARLRSRSPELRDSRKRAHGKPHTMRR